MFDTPNYTPAQMKNLRRVFHSMNHFMVFMWKIGMGRMLNAWPSVGGRILLIKHYGRKSGKEYRTPVNYAIVDNEIYCAAGFGSNTDWYRNVLAKPDVQICLPQGWVRAHAVDVSNSPCRVEFLRAIIVASGFAGPLLGVDQRKLSDEQIANIAREYCLIHFQLRS